MPNFMHSRLKRQALLISATFQYHAVNPQGHVMVKLAKIGFNQIRPVPLNIFGNIFETRAFWGRYFKEKC